MTFCPDNQHFTFANTVKPVLGGRSKRRTKIGFQGQLWLNAGQKYCRMLQGEHSAIFSTFTKLPLVIKIFVLSIFEWPLKSFTVFANVKCWLKSQSDLGLHYLSMSFWQAASVQTF